MRPPDLANEAGTIRAWRWTATPGVGPADWQAGLATWFIQADPGVLDPVFSGWFVGGVSLRDIEGVPPAHRKYPDAQYELVCLTIDPESGVGPEHYETTASGGDNGRTGFLLKPPDIVYQCHGTDDAGAMGVLDAFIRAVVQGGLSPSRPPASTVSDLERGGTLFDARPAHAFDADWRRRLDATVEHFATGHWPHQESGLA
jgi:hypothetical protein